MPGALPPKIGRYEIVERIGYGGVGVVYRARDPRIGRLVAIKVLRVSGEEVRARFVKEAQSAGNLKHPNIVTVYDFGEHEGQPYIVMEFVEGTTLADNIRRGVPMSLLRKLELIEALAAGLGYAHSRGVVHRDIKPANLMIGPDGLLKILDFGIARTADSGLTQAGMRLGTLTYMSPEALQTGVADRRSDIFAVGLVFYEILTGQQAFSGETAAQVIDAVVNGTPAPLNTLCPNMDAAVERVVTRALEKLPARRYQTLDVLAGDIARIRERLLREADETPTGAAIAAVDAAPVAVGPLRRRRLRDIDDEQRAEEIAPEVAQPVAGQPIQVPVASPAVGPGPRAVAPAPRESSLVERVDRAKSAFRERNYLAAIDLLRQVQAVSGDDMVAQLLHEAHAAEAERQSEKRKQSEIAHNLERAKAQLAADQLADALTSLDAVFAIAPDHLEALELGRRLQALLEKRRRDIVLNREATWTVEESQKLFDKGQHTGALALLRAFRPRHPLVTSTIDELDASLFDLARQRLDALVAPRPAAAATPLDRRDERLSPPVAARGDRPEPSVTASPPDRESEARRAIRAARNRIAAHDVSGALEELDRFSPPHPLVTAFVTELRAQLSISDRSPEPETPPPVPTAPDPLADTLVLPAADTTEPREDG